jgi:hypothetical protein
LALALEGVVVGCGEAPSQPDSGAGSDSGVVDAAVADAGGADAEVTDAGAADAGAADAATTDAAVADAATTDAAVADAGAADAGCAVSDRDGDGHDAIVCGGDDCDDDEPGRHPGASEGCNAVDDDCNGIDDDGIAPRACSTACGSGEESCTGGVVGGCTAPMPAVETCNALDDDCDGTADDGVTPRPCSNACGSGTETCTGGVFGGCTAPPVCDLTPTMTDFTAPSGIVTASGFYATGYEPWRAFDSTTPTSTAAMWVSAAGVAPAWVAYEFTDGARTVTSYGVRYTNGSLTTRAPRDWTFQAYDGASWITLDTRSGQTGWTSGMVRTFTIASPGSYTRYRLHVTDDNDASAGIVVISIGEVFLDGH